MSFGSTAQLQAQATPTANQRFQLSTFVGGSFVNTGIDGDHNDDVTVGADLGVHQYFHINPSLEVRGTYPVGGGVVRAKNILGGLNVSHAFGRIVPYGDILFGRGQLNYGSGVPDYLGTTAYVQTPSNVLSLGGGVDVSLTSGFFLKADEQVQRYSTPVLSSGRANAWSSTVGVGYLFDFNRRLLRRH